jgi:hypothetical protein
MKQWFTLGLLSLSLTCSAYDSWEDEESREADTECMEDCCEHHCHNPFYYYGPVESDIEIEREEVDWPGKRDDPLYDALTH